MPSHVYVVKKMWPKFFEISMSKVFRTTWNLIETFQMLNFYWFYDNPRKTAQEYSKSILFRRNQLSHSFQLQFWIQHRQKCHCLSQKYSEKLWKIYLILHNFHKYKQFEIFKFSNLMNTNYLEVSPNYTWTIFLNILLLLRNKYSTNRI